jgi:hypothetical protein
MNTNKRDSKLVAKIWSKTNYDSLTFSKATGIYTWKRSYFYHPTTTLEQFAETIKETGGETCKLISIRDNFRRWPTTSYLEIKFTA